MWPAPVDPNVYDHKWSQSHWYEAQKPRPAPFCRDELDALKAEVEHLKELLHIAVKLINTHVTVTVGNNDNTFRQELDTPLQSCG
jgi:hypothetical protein